MKPRGKMAFRLPIVGVGRTIGIISLRDVVPLGCPRGYGRGSQREYLGVQTARLAP